MELNRWWEHPCDLMGWQMCGRRVYPGGFLPPGAFWAAPNGRWEQIPNTLIDHVVREGEMTIIPAHPLRKVGTSEDQKAREGYPAFYRTLYVLPAERAEEWVKVEVAFGLKTRLPKKQVSIKYLRRRLFTFLRAEGFEKFEVVGSPSPIDTRPGDEKGGTTNSWSFLVEILTRLRLPTILATREGDLW